MKFAGELLIFVLLFITSLRVFFVSEERHESIVVVVPLCFLLSILLIFSWGIDVFDLFALFLSFIVLLSNFHALLRYSSHLYIDHYSPLMKVWAVFDCLLAIIAIAGLVFFAPKEFRSEKMNVVENETRLKGSFRGGFEEVYAFSNSDGTLYEYSIKESEDKAAEDVMIVFFPDKRGDNYNYKPYLQKLAAEGYKVYSADFFSKDCRWLHSAFDAKIFRRFVMVIQSVVNNQNFMSQREFYTYNSSFECQALYDFIRQKNGNNVKFFFISDVMANTAVSDFQKSHTDAITGIFYLDSIEEYATPGYGCIAYTNPLLDYVLGSERDNKKDELEAMVLKTVEAIESVQNNSSF